MRRLTLVLTTVLATLALSILPASPAGASTPSRVSGYLVLVETPANLAVVATAQGPLLVRTTGPVPAPLGARVDVAGRALADGTLLARSFSRLGGASARVTTTAQYCGATATSVCLSLAGGVLVVRGATHLAHVVVGDALKVTFTPGAHPVLDHFSVTAPARAMMVVGRVAYSAARGVAVAAPGFVVRAVTPASLVIPASLRSGTWVDAVLTPGSTPHVVAIAPNAVTTAAATDAVAVHSGVVTVSGPVIGESATALVIQPGPGAAAVAVTRAASAAYGPVGCPALSVTATAIAGALTQLAAPLYCHVSAQPAQGIDVTGVVTASAAGQVTLNVSGASVTVAVPPGAPAVQVGQSLTLTASTGSDGLTGVSLNSAPVPGVGAPTHLTVSSTSSSLVLLWTAPAGATAITGYVVRYRTSATAPWSEATTGPVTSLTLPGVSGTLYWQVVAVTATGDGTWSSVNHPAATPQACPQGGTLVGNQCEVTTSYPATASSSPSGYTCPGGYTLSGTTCVETVSVAPTSGSTTYTCPSGTTISGATCVATTSYAATATPTYTCPSGATLSGSTCLSSEPAIASTTSQCPPGYTLSGSTCIESVPATYTETACSATMINNGNCANVPTSGYFEIGSCPGGGTYTGGAYQSGTCVSTTSPSTTTTYVCPGGYTLSGTTCSSVTTAVTITSYTCPQGGALSGPSCVVTTTTSATASPGLLTCPTGTTLSGSMCTSTTSVPATPASSGGSTSYTCPKGGTLSGTDCVTTRSYPAV